MKTKKVTRYYCSFCGKGKFSKPWMTQHEATCYKNPDRVPYEGELSFIRQTGKVVNFGCSDDLPPGLSWIEWVEHDTMPKWWPGEGKIYHRGDWYAVPGYRVERPSGAHGYAGGPPPEEVWPHYGSGRSLNEIPAKFRWEAFHPDRDPYPKPKNADRPETAAPTRWRS